MFITRKKFKELCNQYCPEWTDFYDWSDGEEWASFSADSDYALAMYDYNNDRIQVAYDFALTSYYEIIPVDIDNKLAKSWDTYVTFAALNTENEFIEQLQKLHKRYKELVIKQKEIKLQEDFVNV